MLAGKLSIESIDEIVGIACTGGDITQRSENVHRQTSDCVWYRINRCTNYSQKRRTCTFIVQRDNQVRISIHFVDENYENI